MKEKWTSTWRPYWVFSIFIFFAALASWWWQSGWQAPDAKRGIASYKSAKAKPGKKIAPEEIEESLELHPEFMKEIDSLYQGYARKIRGTAVCKHFLLENKSMGMRDFLSGMTNHMNKYCLPKTIHVTHIPQGFDPNAEIFIACCDKYDTGPNHFRYE